MMQFVLYTMLFNSTLRVKFTFNNEGNLDVIYRRR